MSNYDRDTFYRLYQIGGADLALRYAEMSSTTPPSTTTKLEITGLRFYNGGRTAPPESERQFSTRFSQNNAQYIYFQLDLRSPWKYISSEYQITACYYNPAGSLMGEIKDEVETNPDWNTFWFTRGWGWEEAGNWKPGTYRVEILIQGESRLSETFTIFEEQVKRPLFDLKSSLLTNPLLDFSEPLSTKRPIFEKPADLFSFHKPAEVEPIPTQGLGFAGWMDRINQLYPTTMPTDKKVPSDDLGKLKWLNNTDQRYMRTNTQARPGKATKETLAELQEIINDYQALLNAPMPVIMPLYTKKDLEVKIADTYSSMAQTCEALHDYDQARQHYSKAINTFTSHGEFEKAKRYQGYLDRLDFYQHGKVDKEIGRLNQELLKVKNDSLEHADLLIELGSIYRQNGDDYEAKKLLHQAEKILEKLGNDPSGEDIANALTNTLLGISQGKQSAGSTDIGTVMKINDLYRLLSVELSRIYKETNPTLAAQYRNKAAQRDSRELNDAFSKKMLDSLEDLLNNL